MWDSGSIGMVAIATLGTELMAVCTLCWPAVEMMSNLPWCIQLSKEIGIPVMWPAFLPSWGTWPISPLIFYLSSIPSSSCLLSTLPFSLLLPFSLFTLHFWRVSFHSVVLCCIQMATESSTLTVESRGVRGRTSSKNHMKNLHSIFRDAKSSWGFTESKQVRACSNKVCQRFNRDQCL